ncbi:MAG: M20/M25/M40 family metallo-hydrolase [Alphaproteobacteria bacterium]|nr:M20/M25/M40 family metallo-hydrolase [Alphaproteobacteria bacterium]
MPPGSARALSRIAFAALVGLAIWAVDRYLVANPIPLGVDAPSSAFSAGRAEVVLARILGPEIPHPVSSSENEAVRRRILAEYAALGIPARTYRALGCHMSLRFPALACATVTDIIAEVRSGRGKAIVMLSHIDSVPAGPGAADDESGTASVLESARALKANPGVSSHPIIAVNTDGEEFGLLGAAAFLGNPNFEKRVGAVVNVEARGNHGQSLLFQTSPGDAPLIDLYAKSVPIYATSSLMPVIYRFLPNDTDLTLFIQKGFLSWNFAFNDNVAHYHTALDRRANLDPVSLQMQGESLLGMVRGLERVSYSALTGADSVYLSVLGRWLPRIPAGWALPLAIAGLFALLFCAFRIEGPGGTGRWMRAFLVLPLMVIGAGVAGWLLHSIAALVSGQSDPAYAYPSLLRASLGTGVLAVALAASRLAGANRSTLAAWLWTSVLGIVTAIFLTGIAAYFVFGLLVAVPLLLLCHFAMRRTGAESGRAIALIAAVPAAVIWMSLVATGETIHGLYLHPVFTVPAAFAMALIMPVADVASVPQRVWTYSCLALGVLAAALAVLAGFQPAFSARSPQRLDIDYVEDATTHRAYWTADSYAPLPASLRKVANFTSSPEKISAMLGPMYAAPAGPGRFASPRVDIRLAAGSRGARHVSLTLRGSPEIDQIVVAVPKVAGLRRISLDGQNFAVPPAWTASAVPYDYIGCYSKDCSGKSLFLDLTSSRAVPILVAEIRYGVPAAGQLLVRARPPEAVASQEGDTTILIGEFTVPPA